MKKITIAKLVQRYLGLSLDLSYEQEFLLDSSLFLLIRSRLPKDKAADMFTKVGLGLYSVNELHSSLN